MTTTTNDTWAGARATLAHFLHGTPAALDVRALGQGRAALEAAAAARDAAIGAPAVKGGVAVVPVMGALAQRAISLWGITVLEGYDTLTERFARALAEPEARGVILVVDSPGGVIAGLEEALGRMARAKRASGKRVIAYVDEQAVSAAYWIPAVLADEIVVPVAGEVGSVGVLAAWADMSGALASEGIKVHIHRSPSGKAPGHPYGPVAEVADDRMARAVSSAADRFTAAVAKARGVNASDVKGWDGATFCGATAVEAGLADRVGTFEVALKAAASPTKGARAMVAMTAPLGFVPPKREGETEGARRESLISAMLADGRATYAKASELRAMPLEGLEAYASTALPAVWAVVGKPRPEVPPVRACPLSDRELAWCKEAGADPRHYARNKARALASRDPEAAQRLRAWGDEHPVPDSPLSKRDHEICAEVGASPAHYARSKAQRLRPTDPAEAARFEAWAASQEGRRI